MTTVYEMREIFEYSARGWKRDRRAARTAEQFKAAQEHLDACRAMANFYRLKATEQEQKQ